VRVHYGTEEVAEVSSVCGYRMSKQSDPAVRVDRRVQVHQLRRAPECRATAVLVATSWDATQLKQRGSREKDASACTRRPPVSALAPVQRGSTMEDDVAGGRGRRLRACQESPD
jgi:hypothetical protein